jgi:diketogulonate reductase-like aldo/keto reductase
MTTAVDKHNSGAAEPIVRAIPRSGELLPAVGLGTWQTFDVGPRDYGSRAALLGRFLELGGRLVDSSPMYGRAETVVGVIAATRGARDALFLATKVWTRGRDAGVAQMRDSMAKLGTSIVDLMQVHNLVDVETHLATLREWRAEGRIRYIGVTHYTVDAHDRLERCLRRGDIDFVQFNYSMAVRDAERRLLPAAAEHGVATLINRPFEGGGLFERTRGKPLPALAASLGCRSWAELALKFVISHPAVTCVIPATAELAHLESNMCAGAGPLPDAAQRRAIVESWAGL